MKYACLKFFLLLSVLLASVAKASVKATLIQVKTSSELKIALSNVKPGDTINLADGVYTDPKFTASVSGTKTNRITIRGSRKAVLTTGDELSGYGLYLKNVNYWTLSGFSVKTAQKGIMLDTSSFNLIENVSVSFIGNEAVHFRCSSSDNVLENSEISFTGRDKTNEGYGEGIFKIMIIR